LFSHALEKQSRRAQPLFQEEEKHTAAHYFRALAATGRAGDHVPGRTTAARGTAGLSPPPCTGSGEVAYTGSRSRCASPPGKKQGVS
jgi:hypothetical protein